MDQVISHILLLRLDGERQAILRVLVPLTGITVDLLNQEFNDLQVSTTRGHMDRLGVGGM